MSTVYTGVPTNVTSPLAATVVGATNASPIVITTSANHLYATGDVVTIAGVTGNTAANGTYAIVVISSTTFSLTGTTGNGAYVSGGTAKDQSLTPQFTIPSDGDAFNAAAFNVAYQALADRTQFLALRSATRTDILTAASGTWTCPAGVFWIEIQAYGGGGGGGGGCPGNAPTTNGASTASCGGGGGGGSRRAITRMAVVPGTVYTYVVGAGGAGGLAVAGSSSSSTVTGGNAGADGSDSTFNSVVVGRGAQGGYGGASTNTLAASILACTPGGKTARLQTAPTNSTKWIINNTFWFSEVGSGGFGGYPPSVGSGVASEGGAAAEGFIGGPAGSAGATVTNSGGGPGGGGGAGPGNIGGFGGTGGTGSATVAGAGSAGTSGIANSGSGGGGGGGGGTGGSGSTGGGGAAGGAGGSGSISINYQGPQANFT